MLCRVLGRCLHGDWLDREVEHLQGAECAVGAKQFTYVRYNVELSRTGLTERGLPNIHPGDVQKLDSIGHMAELLQVGRAVAADVERSHFAGFPLT
jgi:hypothetical protein